MERKLSSDTIGRAIAAADAGANPVWKEAALEIIKEIATRRKYLDTDEVFHELAKRKIDTHERRAMGPVMNKAVANKWIVLRDCAFCGTTKVIKQSIRDESHGKDTAIYKSLLYVETD